MSEPQDLLAEGDSVVPFFSFPVGVALTIEQILHFEDRLAKRPQIECPVREWFVDGLYAREISVPQNTYVTGAEHKHRHLCMLSLGEATVVTVKGMKRLKAPCTFIADPGKLVGYAHTDCVFTSFHATAETDPDKVIEELCTSTRDELQGGSRNKQLLNKSEMEKLPCQ